MTSHPWERYQRSENYLRLKRLIVAYFLLMAFIGAAMLVSGCQHSVCTVNDRLQGEC